ncbi:MAG TPA: TonB-dependent receptor, partial [Bryobacteraceae bacterium]|nr:TonB-dependent receptor [Bryobacteraceae bacterium]
FRIPDLQPSSYEIKVAAKGFASQRLVDITLNVGAQRVLNITLDPSAIEVSVEVKAETTWIELASASLSGVEGAKTIRDLPLNGRDWTQLALLEPGVSAIRTQNSLNGSSSNRGSRGFGSAVTISGGRPTQNNYFLDGISLNDYTNGAPGTALGLALGADAIQEFSVLTNSYNASYGGASGGVVNAVSRSGTNTFHADAFEFLRNDKLDARNFFDGGKPPFRRNQFGAAVGGPIRRDRTFYFANYEGLRRALSTTSIATVPSRAARAGDLSTGKISTSSAIVPYLALWPLPNGPLLGTGDTGQYIFTAKSPASGDFGLIKGNHLISTNDHLAMSWSSDRGQTQSPDALDSVLVNNRLFRNSASLNETHIVNPQIVAVLRAGLNRATSRGQATSPGNNPAASDPLLGVLPNRNAPAITVPGITRFAGGHNGVATTDFWFTNLQLYSDLSMQKGTQFIKVGAQFSRYRYDTQVAAAPNGGYEFPSLRDFLTNREPALFNADMSYSGNDVISVGTGFPARRFRQNVAALYIQDDVRLIPNLTMNLGLRYEMASVPTEINGLVSNLRDLHGTDLNVGEQLFENPTRWNFEPRIGIVWDPFKSGKTSVRAGFGMFDVLPLIYQFSMLEAYGGPFSSLVTLLDLPSGSFPYGGYNAILKLNPSTAPVRVPSIEYDPPRNYVMQWNASVQRSVTEGVLLLLAYAASRGVHMFSVFNDANIVLPTLTTTGYVFPSPVGSGTRLNPKLGSIRQLTWGDNSSYHSLQAKLQKRFGLGFQLQASFTWQKSIDGYSSSVFPTQFQNSTSTLFIDRRLNRGLSDFHVGRVGVINGVWELPQLTSASKALRIIANGWAVGGILTSSDGLPFTPLISGDPSGQNSAAPYAVPDRVVGPTCTNLTNPGNPSRYINLSCYSFPDPINRLGNAGRNSLIGPGIFEIDASLTRKLPMKGLSESAELQIRAEAFNLTNRTNLQPPLPNNVLYNSRGAPLATAGVITSTATTSRQIQLGMRLSW